jgi:zinc transport system substrate-binding protein
MRKILLFVAAILVLQISCSAGNNNGGTAKKPVISVSILPQKFFVEQIAGQYFDVNVILPPGASPEDFEPSPKQIRDVANSDFYFYMGHLGFEKSWIKQVSAVAPGVRFVSCSYGIDLLDHSSSGYTESSASHNHGTDPHIWTSPENVKTISKTICSELSLVYPDKKKDFEKNLSLFITKINLLDTHIRTLLADSIRNSFMIYHPALGYFARDYHLKEYSIEFEDKSPSTAQMKRMVDTARKENINTIFIQSQFETAKAEAIAKEIGAKIVSINNLGENWLSDMYDIAQKMKDALTIKPHEKSN